MLDFSKQESVGEAKHVVEENAKDAPVKDIHWAAQEMQAQSSTKIEDDEGTGGAAIIRMFEFGVNPQAFKQHSPTKQELFNAHAKGIEVMLWRDGMSLMTDVEPKLTFNKNNTKYRIFVGAKPAKGHILREKPQTLSQVVHGA